jgi:Trypsin-like serine proteases, typically periplasmic, contain C-terminal PDZ domain
MYDEVAAATVKIMPGSFSFGSGFFIDDGSRVVTNSHVAGRAQGLLTVETHDHKRYKARIEKVDDINDLAILKLEADQKSDKTIKLGDSTKLQKGDQLFALGHPFGLRDTYISPGKFVERGRFDDLFESRDPKDRDWVTVQNLLKDPKLAGDATAYRGTKKLMIDAQTEPGNSGGPIVDSGAEAVGVVMFGSENERYHRYGWQVPVEEVKNLRDGPDKFQFDYKSVVPAFQHPGWSALTAGATTGLALMPRAGGTILSTIALDNMMRNARGTDATPKATSEKIDFALQWTGDAAMVSGTMLSWMGFRQRIAGAALLAVGVSARIGQMFVPQTELVDIKRSDGSRGEPFLWNR